jgi:hypothetical protein
MLSMLRTVVHCIRIPLSPSQYLNCMWRLSGSKYRSCYVVLQYLNKDVGCVVLMEDTSASVFVAIEEYYSSNHILDRFGSSSSRSGRMVRVVIKACTNLNLLLPYPMVDSGSKVICRTLGEAFRMKVPVWWMEEDAIATCVDGATHTP